MSLLGELSYALIQPSARAIGSIIPDVTIEEVPRDELILSQHPVEGGSAITDHAFKRPAEVDMRCGWSNSTAGFEGYNRQVYDALLALQASRRPFSLSTGKRLYRNMLLRSLTAPTDPRGENILMVLASFQEVIIVSTKTTGTGTATTSAGSSQGGQASPETTGSVTNLGSQPSVNVSDTAFAGAFNPGSFQTDTGPVGLGSSLDGLSAPMEVTLPEQSVTAPTEIGGLQGASPDYYAVFGGGP